MLRSMTGYGRGEVQTAEKHVLCEVRSVNHRFLDISVRLPRALNPAEQNIKKRVGEHSSRGKIDITLQLESSPDCDVGLHLSPKNVEHVLGLLTQIKQSHGLPGDVDLAALMPFRDYIFHHEETDDVASLWDIVAPALDEALKALVEMQDREGAEIAKDIRMRMEDVESVLADVEREAPEACAARREAFKERLKTLCAGAEVDENRLAQEIAVMADKCDITEELVRAKSHVNQFIQWLSTQGPVGRKLDFLMQEINREVNTIGAKASSSDISLMVVKMKNELEKIREQVQNVM